MNKTYCVVYKTGGKEDFKWNRSLGFENKEKAQVALNETIQMGYKAYMVDYDMSINIGLPESYE